MNQKKLPPNFILKKEIATALNLHQPIVALESAVITHGLPYPVNIDLANSLENEVRKESCIPATVGVIEGKVRVGLSQNDIEKLGNPEIPCRKISRRDFSIAMTAGENGGTTVTGTLIAASIAGIKVFATGGIGGVHRNAPFDISADLHELANTPMIVVCSGAKSILDLPATMEYLETMGIPVIGYQTDFFPAFYSSSSGLRVNFNASSPQQIVNIARAHWNMGLKSSVLVTVPPPQSLAIPNEEMEKYIDQAIQEVEEQKISGFAVTPFLLQRVKELSGGKSMETNLALLRNNAHVAATISSAYTVDESQNRII